MSAYYNEIDPFAAGWLRALISKKLIAPGDVDTRDMKDVCPDDLKPYVQHHFFAGIGGWSYAARLAGWPDDRPLATGSCPCQPFSAAGRSGGFVDERHLWPHQHYLIQQCRFPIWCGEQVASPDGLAWLDLVSSDMEATGYAGGAVDICSAGFGSPNIRQRLYLAFRDLAWREHSPSAGPRNAEFERSSAAGGVANGERTGLEGQPRNGGGAPGRREPPRPTAPQVAAGGERAWGDAPGPAPVNGWWAGADWIFCRNPRGEAEWRPVEPGSFPLAHGVPNRVGLLRGYGNAIDPQVAAEFLKAVMAEL